MTVAEAARQLEVSPGTVYLLCREGKLAHHRVGTGRGVIRIHERDVADYVASTRVEMSAGRPAAPARFAPIPDLIGEARARRAARRCRRG